MTSFERVAEILAPFVSEIESRNHWQQRIQFDERRWAEVLADQPAVVKELLPEFADTGLSRRELVEMGSFAVTSGDSTVLRRVYFAMLMFGWGRLRGMGPRNAARAIDSGREFDETLAEVARLIARGDVGAGYGAMTVPGCGAAFVSKFLYFIGRGVMAGGRYPVIFDSSVAAHLDMLMGVPVSRKYASIAYNLGRWRVGYERIVEDMHAWASHLGCEADQLEFFLFRPPPALLDAARSYYD